MNYVVKATILEITIDLLYELLCKSTIINNSIKLYNNNLYSYIINTYNNRKTRKLIISRLICVIIIRNIVNYRIEIRSL